MTADTKNLIVFAGGGTGGHLFPALAIIDWLRRHQPAIRCAFLCTERPVDARILDADDVPYTVQPVLPLPGSVGAAIRFYRAWRASLQLCLDHLRRDRPIVVLGTGGYGSGPPVKAAAKMGIPSAMLNPDLLPGRANRYLSRYVEEVYVQWQESARYFPRRLQIRTTGCPVRRAFLEPSTRRDAAHFGLSPDRRTLLVTGASSGAQSINQAFALLAPELAQLKDWQILHITGADHQAVVEQAYRQAGAAASAVPFTHHMPAAMRSADLVVSRAGAVSIAELIATGTPAILMPYPYHKDNHQRLNAETLARSGAAVVVDDLKDGTANADQLRKVLLPLMADPQALLAMSAVRRAAPAADPAERIAHHLFTLAGIDP